MSLIPSQEQAKMSVEFIHIESQSYTPNEDLITLQKPVLLDKEEFV